MDHEHLKWLSIGYYATAGLHALFSLFFMAYAGFMAALFTGRLGPASHGPAPMPAFFAWFMAAFFAITVLFGLGTAVLNVIAGVSLAARRRRTFCLVVAAVNCMNMPFGTVLGVFTFVVLGRPSVRAEFEAQAGA